MLNTIRTIILILIIAVFASASVQTVFAEEVIDSIAAIVDNEIILESEISYGISTLLLESGIRYPSEDQVSDFRDQVLNAYITQKILLARAEEETLTVEDRVINRELERKLEGLIKQIGSEEKLIEYFGKPMRRIKREMRDGVRDGLLIERLKQAQIQKVRIRRRDIVQFYEDNVNELPVLPAQVELSHILLEVKASDEAQRETMKKTNAYRDLLLKGADFDSLAAAVSEDPSAEEGGRLGFTSRGDLVPAYEEAAFDLEPGEISDVVETRYGVHIIKLLERQGERISTQHILVIISPNQDDWKRERELAATLRERINSGESFSSIALQYSDDVESSAKGGKIDKLAIQNLPDEFQIALEDLNVGEISQPFETMFGIHIIRLERREAEHKISLTDDWQTLEMYAMANKREIVFNEWVKTLEADHYIWPNP